MSEFFSLPNDILVPVLNVWLYGKNIAALDIACCCMWDRFRLMHLLIGLHLPTRFSDHKDWTSSVVFLRWASSRKCIPYKIVLDGTNTKSTAILRASLNPLVRSAKVIKIDDEKGFQIVANAAKEVESLQIAQSQGNTDGGNFRDGLPTLRKLQFMDSYAFNLVFLGSFVSAVPNLARLTVDYTGVNDAQISLALMYHPKITHLSCRHCHKLTPVLVNNPSHTCPALRWLDVTGCKIAARLLIGPAQEVGLTFVAPPPPRIPFFFPDHRRFVTKPMAEEQRVVTIAVPAPIVPHYPNLKILYADTEFW